MLHFTIKKHGNFWSDRRFLRAAFFGLLLMAIGLGASFLAREHLEHALRAEWGPDIFLDNLPVLKLKDFLVWGMQLLICFVIAVLVLYPEYIPFALKTIGLLYLIRAFFIILTPLGNRPDQVVETTQGLFYNLAYSSNDFFFSGHVSFPFMLMCIFWRKKLIRYAMLMATVFFAAAVLLAHTHYSIDVFSVFFIIPTIFGLSRFLFDRDIRYTHVDYTARADHIPPLL